MEYQNENRVIQQLAKQLVKLVDRRLVDIQPTKVKSAAHDVVTPVDLAADRLIVSTIRRHFPGDGILTEESSPHVPLGEGRMWIVDPICGTGNCSRGIRFFVSNIALADQGRVRAAWAVDHSRKRVIWSKGNGLWVDRRRVAVLKLYTSLPHVDANWGYHYHLPKKVQEKYAKFVTYLRLHGNVLVTDAHSSLIFSYVATGQMQGVVTININVWDYAAPAFLVEQNGGVVTNFDGTPWSLQSKHLIVAGDRLIHSQLLAQIRRHGLANI